MKGAPKRDVVLSVRVSSKEEADLKQFARMVDLPLGTLIRQALKEILRRAAKTVESRG